MNNKEKAKILLEQLDNVIQIDWNFKDCYIKALEAGLLEIKKKEVKERP